MEDTFTLSEEKKVVMAQGFWPRECPSCHRKLCDPALSKWDNKTPICGDCYELEIVFVNDNTLSSFSTIRARDGSVEQWFKAINDYYNYNPKKRKKKKCKD